MSLFCAAAPAAAQTVHETVRLATYTVELSRKGPGLLLRDITGRKDPQVRALIDVIEEVAPDILVLQSIDYDHELLALSALRDQIAETGLVYPHLFARRPNTGRPSGLDLDGDGRLGEPEDHHGYGWFSGDGGMAILSKHAFNRTAAVDFSDLLWTDLPGALIEPEWKELRLSRVAHWVVPVTLGNTEITLLTFHAGPPVFDGLEDRNGRRNHDEILFWMHYLAGQFGAGPDRRFVLTGNANLDPNGGEGLRDAIGSLLTDPRLQDPKPRRPGMFAPASLDAFHTVNWPEHDPGPLRVSYVLPSQDLTVVGSGVFWPEPEDHMLGTVDTASRHRLVWVDLKIPD